MKVTKDNPNTLRLVWNGDTGEYQGAQCTRFTEVQTDKGIVQFRGEGAPIGVGEAVTGGFPLADVIGEANVSLLVAVEKRDAEIAELKTSLANTQSLLAAALTKIAELTKPQDEVSAEAA